MNNRPYVFVHLLKPTYVIVKGFENTHEFIMCFIYMFFSYGIYLSC